MKVVVSAIGLVIAAGFGALRIFKVAKGDGTASEKVTAIHDELSKILDKLQSLAANTAPEWDDSLAEVLSSALDAIAESIISGLEE